MITVVMSKVNLAFEALGSPIRAAVEDGELFVRDLIIVDTGEGTYEIFEAAKPDAPIHSFSTGDPASVAGVVALHIVRRIITKAIDD